MIHNPCKHCIPPERHPGCQDTCEKGISWAKHEKKRRARIAAERKKDTEVISCAIELKENVRKEQGRRY